MHTGEEFSVEQKKLIFRVIDFVESERDGLKIAVTSTSARIMALLGISYSSVHRLKKELNELREQETIGDDSDDEKVESISSAVRTRSQSNSVFTRSGHRKTKKTWSARTVALSASSFAVPTPLVPKKTGYVGRSRVVLNEAGEDIIRYHFHLILVEINDFDHICLSDFGFRLNDVIQLLKIFSRVS